MPGERRRRETGLGAQPLDLGGQLGLGGRNAPRVTRLADGWLASAYNTTPELFADGWSSLAAQLPDHGKVADDFPNTLTTMWCYITDDRDEAERILTERVATIVHRPVELLRERLPIGPPELFAEKLAEFACGGGAARGYIWPVADEVEQLERFWKDVRPLVAGSSS